jgi:hypothetical protein
MKKELSDCPFCGSDEIQYNARCGKYGWFVFCNCAVCGAESKKVAAGPTLDDEWAESIVAHRAAAAWNRRWNNGK